MNAHAEKGQALSGHRGCVCPWVGEKRIRGGRSSFRQRSKRATITGEHACYIICRAVLAALRCPFRLSACTVATLNTVRYPMCTWRARAQAEGLTLRVADNKAGYFGVFFAKPGQPKPYQAQVRRGGKVVSLGSFATAEEAALCFARSPEGQEAAKRASAP